MPVSAGPGLFFGDQGSRTDLGSAPSTQCRVTAHQWGMGPGAEGFVPPCLLYLPAWGWRCKAAGDSSVSGGGTESTCAPRHRSRAPRQRRGARTVTPVLACVPHRSLTSPLPQNVGTHWMSLHPPMPRPWVPAPQHVATGQQRTSRSTQGCSSSCCQCGWKMPFGQEPPGFFQPCPGKKKKAHKTPVVAVAKRKRQIRARLEPAPRPPRDERRLRESLPVPCGQRTPKILTRPCAARSHGPKSQQELAAPVLPARWSSGDGGAAGSRAGCSLITSVLQNLPPPLATPVSRCSFSAGWGIAAFPPD